MPEALTWDETGARFYETGVDHGVLYVYDSATEKYAPGVAWNGLITVTETPSGAEPTALYADNIKYLNMFSAEEFTATVEAFTYPDEFNECDGIGTHQPGVLLAQQPRKMFGMCYRTLIGNDVDGDALGYKLHLLYGCTASPSEKTYTTKNDSPEAITFSWEVSTVPVPVTGFAATSLIVIDSRTADATELAALETKLYGSSTEDAEMPLPDDVLAFFTATSGN